MRDEKFDDIQSYELAKVIRDCNKSKNGDCQDCLVSEKHKIEIVCNMAKVTQDCVGDMAEDIISYELAEDTLDCSVQVIQESELVGVIQSCDVNVQSSVDMDIPDCGSVGAMADDSVRKNVRL